MRTCLCLMVCAFFSSIVITSHSHASTVTMDVEVDLSTLYYPSGPYYTDRAMTEFQDIDPFTISQGDSLCLNFSFADLERLSILSYAANDMTQIWVSFRNDGEYVGSGRYDRESYISFEDVEGDLKEYTEPFLVGGGSTDMWYLAASGFTDSEFSFSGFNTQTDYVVAETPFTANQVGLSFVVGNAYGVQGVIARIPAPVPAPAAGWLLGSGLIGIVGIRRKFKN